MSDEKQITLEMDVRIRSQHMIALSGAKFTSS